MTYAFPLSNAAAVATRPHHPALAKRTAPAVPLLQPQTSSVAAATAVTGVHKQHGPPLHNIGIIDSKPAAIVVGRGGKSSAPTTVTGAESAKENAGGGVSSSLAPARKHAAPTGGAYYMQYQQQMQHQRPTESNDEEQILSPWKKQRHHPLLGQQRPSGNIHK
jgi:hypothetical protein